jgi:hypothetical protein
MFIFFFREVPTGFKVQSSNGRHSRDSCQNCLLVKKFCQQLNRPGKELSGLLTDPGDGVAFHVTDGHSTTTWLAPG